MWSVLWISLALMLSASVSIVTAVLGSLGTRDEAQIYLVVDLGFDGQDDKFLAGLGVTEIGLKRAPVARMIFADEHSHMSLVESGYWLMPAGMIAALCGIQRT